MNEEALVLKIKENKKIPFHMPGHKRNNSIKEKKEYLKYIPYELDITEINGFDNLHDPNGIIKEIMKAASDLWNSKKSFLMINGSTGGILASIYAAVGLEGHLLISRNCHKSVYHAAEIFNLKLSYIFPEMDLINKIFTKININKLEKILKENNDIKAFLLTTPTYEGHVSDISMIAKICHKHNVILIVDQAHGAHFGLSSFFSKSACQLGADITIQSLHKTLYALTSTAILHLNSDFLDENSIMRALGIFQTSSPSYILISSIDSCIRLIQEEKNIFEIWSYNLSLVDEVTKNLKFLKILYRNKKICEYDKSKIIVSCLNTSINAVELSNILREKYGIEVEMVSTDYIIAMTGMGDSKESILKFLNAIVDIDKDLFYVEDDFNANNRLFVDEAFSKEKIYFAVSSNSIELKRQDAINKISSEYIWAYPPGIPIIVPGEIITKKVISCLEYYERKNIHLQYSKTRKKGNITVMTY